MVIAVCCQKLPQGYERAGQEFDMLQTAGVGEANSEWSTRGFSGQTLSVLIFRPVSCD
jgi:hypothetical protein